MLSKVKATSVQLVNDPNARTLFILGTLLLAALVGAAPHGLGGNG
jgi:hypothetical protein